MVLNVPDILRIMLITVIWFNFAMTQIKMTPVVSGRRGVVVSKGMTP